MTSIIKPTEGLGLPDTNFLSLLKPRMPGVPVYISPPKSLYLTDASSTNLGANTVSIITFGFNDISAGTWAAITGQQAVLFESLRCGLNEADSNGQLQIISAHASIGDGATGVPLFTPASLPFTYPAISMSLHFFAAATIPLLYGPPAIAGGASAGPTATIVVRNLDPSNTHAYKRILGASFRLVDNVDLQSAVSFQGCG